MTSQVTPMLKDRIPPIKVLPSKFWTQSRSADSTCPIQTLKDHLPWTDSDQSSRVKTIRTSSFKWYFLRILTVIRKKVSSKRSLFSRQTPWILISAKSTLAKYADYRSRSSQVAWVMWAYQAHSSRLSTLRKRSRSWKIYRHLVRMTKSNSKPHSVMCSSDQNVWASRKNTFKWSSKATPDWNLM